MFLAVFFRATDAQTGFWIAVLLKNEFGKGTLRHPLHLTPLKIRLLERGHETQRPPSNTIYLRCSQRRFRSMELLHNCWPKLPRIDPYWEPYCINEVAMGIGRPPDFAVSKELLT